MIDIIEQPNIRLYCDDFVNTTVLNEESIDLIVTSPPYNLDMKYSDSEDALEYEDYLKFTHDWLYKAYGLLKSDGRFCLNLPLDKNKGGQKPMTSDVLQIAKMIGYQYHSTIIWNEGNISRRTAWGSWMSASAPYVIAPVETILVLYKHQWKKEKRDPKPVSDIARDEFMAWTNGLWTFNGERAKRIGHPAPFPRELPKRCIKLFSYVGDTILDPFAGSGTTLLEAVSNQRIGIGFDISNQYCLIAKTRLKEYINNG